MPQGRYAIGDKVIYANGLLPRTMDQEWPGFGDTGTILEVREMRGYYRLGFRVKWDREACGTTEEFLTRQGRSTCWLADGTEARVAYLLAQLASQPKMKEIPE